MSLDAGENEPLLLTTDVAARRLGISPRTLWTMTARGEIRAIRIGRAVRYYVRDLVAWIEGRRGDDGQHQQ